MREIKQGASTSIKVFITTTDSISGATGLTPSFSFSNAGTTMTTVNAPASTEDAYGWYNLGLTTVHTATLGDVAFHSTGAGYDPVDFKVRVIPRDWVDISNITTSLATISTRVGDVRDGVLGAITVNTTLNTMTITRVDSTAALITFNLTQITGTAPYYNARTT